MDDPAECRLKGATQLRIATWNVLADAYASPKRYAYAGNADVLSWPNHRLGKMQQILADCSADILVLQEVDYPDTWGIWGLKLNL